jgi:hypothetical protein
MKEETNLIQGEKTFPIYRVDVSWVEDGEHDDKYGGNHLGLPKGRIWNSLCGKNIIKKEEMTQKEMNLYAYEYWKNYKDRKLKDKNPELARLNMSYVEHEVWCLTWFQHETFDLGQTDEEVLESFRKFVYRKQEQNYKNGHQENDRVNGNNKPFHCLMGAEDRWRWKGAQEGNADSPSDPPCRCKHCKEQGMIRIGH